MEEERDRGGESQRRNVLSFDDPEFQPAQFVNEKFPDGRSCGLDHYGFDMLMIMVKI